MVTIRNEQRQAFAAEATHRFEDRAITFLRDKYPQQCSELTRPLEELIRDMTAQGRVVGLRSELGVMVLCQLTLLHGEDFHTREPWARRIIFQEGYDAQTKLKLLLDRLKEDSKPAGDS